MLLGKFLKDNAMELSGRNIVWKFGPHNIYDIEVLSNHRIRYRQVTSPKHKEWRESDIVDIRSFSMIKLEVYRKVTKSVLYIETDNP